MDVLLDKLHEECGIFGIFGHAEASTLTQLGLFALQHRGQESAGIAVSNGEQILVYKDMGLVSQVFDERALESLKGHIAVDASPGCGTRISVRVPLAPPPYAADPIFESV